VAEPQLPVKNHRHPELDFAVRRAQSAPRRSRPVQPPSGGLVNARGTIARELVLEALTMALERRRHPEQQLCHSDRGSRSACADVQALLMRHGSTASMSRKGN
jgi:hypothetical protein